MRVFSWAILGLNQGSSGVCCSNQLSCLHVSELIIYVINV